MLFGQNWQKYKLHFIFKDENGESPKSTSAFSFPVPVRSKGASWVVAASASVACSQFLGPGLRENNKVDGAKLMIEKTCLSHTA